MINYRGDGSFSKRVRAGKRAEHVKLVAGQAVFAKAHVYPISEQLASGVNSSGLPRMARRGDGERFRIRQAGRAASQ
ncbi:hypothetical protein CWO90_47010 [Bradyrhizobium sp. Leo121]|nr:hypothetical protein CWO90_47010 [Bradyrhizobium sp. Leo121]